jgi:lysozyme family protein
MIIYKIIDDVLDKEGGYVNHNNDRGGPTNFGITKETLEAWRHKKLTADDVKALSRTEAFTIYKHNYYLNSGITGLPILIQPIVFDMAVNMGPSGGIKLLQKLLNKISVRVVVDGNIGYATRYSASEACKNYPDTIINLITTARIERYKAIAARDPEQKVFLSGWIARAESFSDKKA